MSFIEKHWIQIVVSGMLFIAFIRKSATDGYFGLYFIALLIFLF